MAERAGLDPVTMRVLGGALTAIAKEMGLVLLRMSYSSIIRESEDLGAGLFDATGREICESETTPMHIGSLPWYIRGFLTRLDGKIQDGDVIMHNHPYFGASHTPDVGIAVPVFWEGELLGFSAVTAHLADVGGAYPGINCDVIDLWAEAKIYHSLKLYSAGVRNEELWTHIFDNVRTATMNRGDIEAMIAACQRGRQRWLELVARYGKETVMSAAGAWMDYSEQMLRREVAKIPDGEYHAVEWLDDDGKHRGVPLKVNVTVRVQGSDITVDLTGSSPEVETAFNTPFDGSTRIAAYYIVRSLLLDEVTYGTHVPQNEGIFRSINVVAPKGSIFNPTFPRACNIRFNQCQRVADGVLKALAPVLPRQVTAGNSAQDTFIAYSGFDHESEEYWVYLEVDEGSYGGRYNKDGCDSVDNLIINTRNNPIEEMEWRFPMRCLRYELRDEPPAAGQWRGGIGVVRENQFLVPGFISTESDGQYQAPWGAFGGQDGWVGALVKNPGRPDQEALPAKVSGYRMPSGSVLQILQPSAGGYGDPCERDPEQVREDVLDGFITPEIAARDYGVVLQPQTLALDADATAARRSERRSPAVQP